jgi:hypothetical protein
MQDNSTTTTTEETPKVEALDQATDQATGQTTGTTDQTTEQTTEEATEQASQTKKDRLPALEYTTQIIMPEGLTEEQLGQVKVKVSSKEFDNLIPVFFLKDLIKFGVLRNARSSIVKAKNAGITSGEFEPENMKKASASKQTLEQAKEAARQEERDNFRKGLLAQGFPEEQVESILASMITKPADQGE